MNSRIENKEPSSHSSHDDLTALLCHAQQKMLIDDEFIQQHASAFTGYDYEKYQELYELIATGKALHKKLNNQKNHDSYDTLRIEIKGFATDIKNKIKKFKIECEKRIKEVDNKTRDYSHELLKQKKKLMQYKSTDAKEDGYLAENYMALINSYISDIENLQTQRESFNITVYEEQSEYKETLKDIIAKIFYVTHFEKSILNYQNEKREQLENTLITIYKEMIERSIEKTHEALTRQQAIQHHFLKHVDQKTFHVLTSTLKTLRSVLYNIEKDNRQSLDAWHEKTMGLKQVHNDYHTYLAEFHEIEKQRRKNSIAAKKIAALSAIIEEEMARHHNDQAEFLSMLKDNISASMNFYINGNSYTRLSPQHTPEKMDAILLQNIQSYALERITSLQSAKSVNDKWIAWARNLLSPLSNTKSSEFQPTPTGVADHDLSRFTFRKNIQEKTLESYVDAFTNALYPETSSYVLSFWPLSRWNQPNSDMVTLLVELQCLVAEKSEDNLKKIVTLTSQKTAPTQYAPLLQKIGEAATDLLHKPTPSAQVMNP